MHYAVKSKSMLMLLPLLAACSGADGQSTAAAPELETAVAAQGVAQPAVTVKALSDFDVWTRRLMNDRLSPVVANTGDLTQTWTGADGRSANVVVRVPRTAGKATVSVSPPAPGGDATPVIQAAVAQIKKQGGGILKVAPGQYVFRTTNTEAPGAHVLIRYLADVDIQGAGAEFVFQNEADGIFIQDSQRIRIQGVSMRDSRELAGTGRMRLVNGDMQLVLDRPLPDGVKIHGAGPMNEGSHTWPQSQQRATFFPGGSQPVRIDSRTFVAPEFKNIKDGTFVSVKYTYYGNRAVYVRDSYTGSNEDVVMDGLHIGSTGGVGILIKSRGRGFAVQNSSFSADPGRPYSAGFDGVHVITAGGDILVRGNSMLHTGDDPINLRSIIHKVTALGTDSVTLNNDARMIRVGDEVAFFNRAGEYLGRRVIKTAPPIGNSDTVTFGLKPGEPITEAAFARDIMITPRRFAIVDNTLAESVGRGMLIQIPNGLIHNNVLRALPRTAIRLLTSFDPWGEGAGAINVRISNNSIDSGGAEIGFTWKSGIITALGEVVNARIPTNMHNGPLWIENNKFTAPRAACIVIYNTKGLVEQNNVCGS